MYALMSKERPAAAIDFKVDEAVELHYWRKHPNLHGWMEQLYRAKGGTKPDFNCVALQLTAEDLDKLEQAIREDALPQTSGFFFGASDGSEKEDDLAFVAKAREALSTGHTVIYDSWW
ncbi:phosphoglycerate kinase [Sinorhizobium medicae]